MGAGLTGAKLKIGQYLTCLVEEVKSNGGIVSLSVEHAEISSAFATEEQSWNLNNLLPGLVVKAQVQKVSCLLLLMFEKFVHQMMVVHALIPALMRQRQVELCECKASLVLKSSTIARATQRNRFLPRTKRFISFVVLCMESGYVRLCGACEEQSHWICLELKLQEGVNCLVWILDTELWSFQSRTPFDL